MNRVEFILLGAILVVMVLTFISLDLRTTSLEEKVSSITKQLEPPTTVYFELDPDEGGTRGFWHDSLFDQLQIDVENLRETIKRYIADDERRFQLESNNG